MQSLSLQELAEQADLYDGSVARTRGIDAFCSSSFWVLPATRYLMPPSEPYLFRSGDVFALFSRTRPEASWTLLQPLEAMWGLPCPLIGGEPDDVTDAFSRLCVSRRDWDVALVTGIPPRSELSRCLEEALGNRFSLRPGPVTRRYLASLEGGMDGFLSRRSAGFRRNLKKAIQKVEAQGISFEVSDARDEGQADALYQRLLAVERKSWKGQRGIGIDRGRMCDFYRDVNRRLVAKGAQRVLFARRDGRDVAYIFGGVFGRTYRGLQFSFDAGFGDLSLGNVCQMEEIRRLCEEGYSVYDLGTDVSYKRRWGERLFDTHSVIVQR